jgi:hypothetical protein
MTSCAEDTDPTATGCGPAVLVRRVPSSGRPYTDPMRARLAVILEVGTGPNRLLRAGLAGARSRSSAVPFNHLLFVYPFSVDLRSRPSRGSLGERRPAALASAFSSLRTDPTVPLPAVQPAVRRGALAVPKVPQAAWLAICLGAGILAVRRLAIPWICPVRPRLVAFAEPIIGGNVQIVRSWRSSSCSGGAWDRCRLRAGGARRRRPSVSAAGLGRLAALIGPSPSVSLAVPRPPPAGGGDRGRDRRRRRCGHCR